MAPLRYKKSLWENILKKFRAFVAANTTAVVQQIRCRLNYDADIAGYRGYWNCQIVPASLEVFLGAVNLDGAEEHVQYVQEVFARINAEKKGRLPALKRLSVRRDLVFEVAWMVLHIPANKYQRSFPSRLSPPALVSKDFDSFIPVKMFWPMLETHLDFAPKPRPLLQKLLDEEILLREQRNDFSCSRENRRYYRFNRSMMSRYVAEHRGYYPGLLE